MKGKKINRSRSLSLSIPELKKKWKEEKYAYTTTEVGSGVQKFVKDILKSHEVFDLREGKLTTELSKRQNEFIEEARKLGHQADVVIFINPDIIIPTEIEKYQNIEAGKKQILQYQIDWDKKYGVLTDGYSWRFYNNNIYREFTLKQIFDDTPLFMEFWKEYIKPEGYYLSFFEGPRGQQFLFKHLEKLHVEKYREIFFNDITKLIVSFNRKLEIDGYFNSIEKKQREKKAIEITYAYIIQFILYKTLVDNDFGTFAKDYKANLYSIYEHLKNKTYKYILGIIDDISSRISENIYSPFIKEQKFISCKFHELYRKRKNKLADISPWLDIFIFINKYSFNNVKNEIFGFIYENYLKELYEEGKKGQYFTDPAVVNFMLKQIGYTPDVVRRKIKSGRLDKISIIDPACGSGTFLYSACDRIIKSFGGNSKDSEIKTEQLITNSIFGLDIAEFPLYLAEMNILMRMLPLIITEKYNYPVDKKIKLFLTNDSIAEFVGSSIYYTFGGQRPELDLGYQELEYDSFMRTTEDMKEMKESLKGNHIPRRRFDYVISNPPYISYNECSQQDIQIFKLIQEGRVKLSNIYGVNLHSVPNDRKKYAPKPNIYLFFIALGLGLLKNKGKLCYIVPRPILVNTDSDVIRYHLANLYTIDRIITFSSKLFVRRGLKQKKEIITSSMIFTVKKEKPLENHKVKIISHKKEHTEVADVIKDIESNRNIETIMVTQSYLKDNYKNWNFLLAGECFLKLYDNYKSNSEDIVIYYDHKVATNRFGTQFYFDGSVNIPKKKILYKSDAKIDNCYRIPMFKSKGFLIKTDGYYPKNVKIKIAQGSQGLIVAKPKYKIMWKYINHDRFYFIEGQDILPVYQQYCITSDNKSEILYLFAILNSKLIECILKSFLKVKHEDKLSFLLGVKAIKNYVRVPKINKANEHIKDEIINSAKEMLRLEEITLSDNVDFTDIMRQKFDGLEIDRNILILKYNDNETKLKISKNVEFVKKVITQEVIGNQLQFPDRKLSLSELKNLQLIDIEKQNKLKDYIDDLVFALYFNLTLKNIGFNMASSVKDACRKSKFYRILQ